jgi:23S rRNA (guanosine2251-2'-O)-methyltransferase
MDNKRHRIQREIEANSSSEFTNYIYGRNPVLEALASGREIEKIFICFGTKGDSINRIYALSKKKKIPCSNLDKRKFASLEKLNLIQGGKSQGVIAIMRQFAVYSLDELIQKSYEQTNLPVLLALDGITDPHNLGAIARSAECSAVQGIILPEHNSAPITPAAVKASAGAIEHIPISKVNNLTQSLITLKEKGFWIIGTDSLGEKLYTDEIYNQPVVILIGSEGEGLRHGVLNQCDFTIRIPILGKITSLNASVSAGIILYEILRQRGFSKD